MINKILDTVVKSLSKEAFLETQSKDELKAIYTLWQVFRLLTFIILLFSLITYLFIRGLLDPQSSLLEWSRNHQHSIRIAYLVFVYTPVMLVYCLVTSLNPIATACYKKQPFLFLAPRKVTRVMIFLSLLIFPLFLIL